MQTAEVVDQEAKSSLWERFKEKFSCLPVPLTPREMLIDTASTVRTAAWTSAPFWWPIVKSFFGKIVFYLGVAAKTLVAIFTGTS